MVSDERQAGTDGAAWHDGTVQGLAEKKSKKC